MPNPYPVYPAPEGTEWDINLTIYHDEVNVRLIKQSSPLFEEVLFEKDVSYWTDEASRDLAVWKATKWLHHKYMNSYSKRESYETTVEPTFAKDYD